MTTLLTSKTCIYYFAKKAETNKNIWKHLFTHEVTKRNKRNKSNNNHNILPITKANLQCNRELSLQLLIIKIFLTIINEQNE